MRFALVLLLVSVLVSPAAAGVTARVYLADEQTPLALVDPNVPNVYRDIMVGTHLTIFIESDAVEDTAGALSISPDDLQQGLIAGRGFDGLGYWGSCLESAGSLAAVSGAYVDGAPGFQFDRTYTGQSGRWFVFDYYATGVGICEVRRYDLPGWIVVVFPPKLPPDPDPPVLVQTLSFSHVASRDFDGDTIVDFADFATLAATWNRPAMVEANGIDPPDPNTALSQNASTTGLADLNGDGLVDTLDMLLFSDFWLESTDLSEPNDPNASGAGAPDAPPAGP